MIILYVLQYLIAFNRFNFGFYSHKDYIKCIIYGKNRRLCVRHMHVAQQQTSLNLVQHTYVLCSTYVCRSFFRSKQKPKLNLFSI